MLSSTLPNSKSWKCTRCVQRSLQPSSRQYERMTPEETVNESALGWLWEETYIAAAEVEAESSLHSSTASDDFLRPGSATSCPEGSHHGQAGLRNSVIDAFTGRNDARNKGDEALVFGDGTCVLCMAVRPVAFSGRTEMCSSSTPRTTTCAHASLRGSPLRTSVGRHAGPTPSAVSAHPALRFGITGSEMMGQEHIRNLALIGEDVAVVCAVAEADAEVREQLKRELARPCGKFARDQGLPNSRGARIRSSARSSPSFACSTWRGEV